MNESMNEHHLLLSLWQHFCAFGVTMMTDLKAAFTFRDVSSLFHMARWPILNWKLCFGYMNRWIIGSWVDTFSNRWMHDYR